MAVNLSPVGGVAGQFFDNNGNPLAGGKLYTYSAGTTTPQTTFTDSLGATLNSNPIILNSGGRVPSEIWLTDGLAYKFVLYTSNDVLLGTWDNISGINSNFVNFINSQEIQTATSGQTVFTLATMEYQPGTNSMTVYVDGVNQYGSGALYAYVETNSTTITFNSGLHVGAEVKFTSIQQATGAATDAAQVSYQPAGTGAVTTNVQTKLRETVSVKDFGAVGDGVTDDSDAFERAAKAAPKAQVTTQGNLNRAYTATVYVPSGNYNITRVIDSEGTQIRWVLDSGAVIPNLSVSNSPLDSNATYTLNPAFLFGSISYNDKKVFLRPCGSRDQNTGFYAQVSGNPQRGSEVDGFSEYSSVANYADRDAVAIYSDSYADPNEQISLASVSSYTATSVNLAPSLSSDQVSRLRIGMMIDTKHTGAKFTGTIIGWDVSGSYITVQGWYAMGNTASGQVPSGTIGIFINPVTKVWGMNTQIKIPTSSNAHAASGIEIGLSDWKAESERFETGRDVAIDDSPHYVWGCHITNFTSNKIQAHLQLDGNSWYAIKTNANVANGLFYQGGGSALITQNATLDYRGRILNDGRYFWETKTALVTNTPDENPANSFYWDSTFKLTPANGATIEFGRQYGISTPDIKFHSSGGNIDYDCKINASGGDGLTVGEGDLEFVAKRITQNGILNLGAPTAKTISSGSITITSSNIAVDTEGATASDDLENILGGAIGDIIWIRPVSDTRTIVVVPTVGNIRLNGATSFTMDSFNDSLCLYFNGTNWLEQGRGNNGS
jgi:hypothetical protein